MYLDIVLSIFALGVAVFAARLLLRRGWIRGFVRGCCGAILIGSAAVVGLVALDLYSYKRILQDKRIATISFEKRADQTFEAVLVPDGVIEPQQFLLNGDQWQLDAKVIRWSGLLKVLAGKPAYRLDRLSGRYLSLDDERSKARTVHAVGNSTTGIDFWTWSRKISDNSRWVDASYGSATFVPMAHGALYEVAISESGLVARPMNEAAQEALGQWR